MNTLEHALNFLNILLIAFVVYSFFKEAKPDIDFQTQFREGLKGDIYSIINRLSESATSGFEKIREVVDLAEELDKTRGELNNIKIDKSRIEETFARKEREIEHKLGLERQRQAQELELAIRESTIKLKEENLKHERSLFEKEVDSIQKRFESQLTDQNRLINNLLEALPNMKIVRHENVNSLRDG